MSRRNLNAYVSTNWGGGNAIEIDNYLTIVALEDGLTAKLFSNTCEYCVDGDGNWKTLSAGTNTEEINTGQTLSFRGNLTPSSNNGIGRFAISKSCNLEGNCMSMLFGDDASSNTSLSGKDWAFYELFYRCTTIKSVSSGFLPATTLASWCYYEIFRNCTSLTQAPELPAMRLTEYCYRSMFSGCTSLTTAPVLPATTLLGYCYYNMFLKCTSLTTAPVLPATTLTEYCYNGMFQGCTSLTQSPALPATTLAKHCYWDMFYNTNIIPDCSNIDFSNASVVLSGGLHGLFRGTKVTNGDLERILPKNSNGKYCLPVMTLATYCYQNMFEDCTSLTTAPELPATTLANYCYYYMFEGCTSLTTAPELPATTLVEGCYDSMFKSCSKLSHIEARFTTTPSTSYTRNWVSGVASKGQFVKNFQATWNVTGVHGVPSGWTITTA